MLVAPVRRRRLIARFRRVAMTCGALPVRTCDRSSPNVTLRDPVDPVQAVLDAPVSAEPGRQLVRAGLVDGQVGDGVDGLGAPLLAVAFMRTLRVTWM